MLRLDLVTLVAVACAAPLNPELDTEWQTFKQHYNKQYPKEEESGRRLAWERNVRYIVKHNLEADRGEHSYRLGVNEYADMTSKEFVRQMNGFRMMNGTSRGATFLPQPNIKVPDTVDWRTKGYVTPVKNQLKCGSCWAFSTTGSLEGQHFKSTGKLVSLSEQNLDGTCRFKKADVGATDTGFRNVHKDDENALKQAVATVGPISVAIDSGHPSFHLYKSGVYNEPLCNSVILNHAVLAVGYGSLQGQDYWLVKNSYGESWGDKGYILMSRNKNNQCGIATAASYPTV